MMRMTSILILACFAVGALHSCQKVKDDSTNPFGGGQESINPIDSLDPQTIQGLHQSIFSVRCANPACHDGTFEPDFRTIESTYNSLVYHPVVKNDTSYSFEYRVVPKDPEKSWLIERLLTDDPVLGRMPIYAEPLSEPEMNDIIAWINNGAPDIEGNPAKFPNKLPDVKYYYVVDTNGTRIDTLRSNGWSSPFILPPNQDMVFAVRVEDDSTLSQNLLDNVLKFSFNQDDFSMAQSYPATFYTNNTWIIALSSNNFPSNQQVFFRYYTRDPEHSDSTEYPKGSSPYYYKQNASFIIQ